MGSKHSRGVVILRGSGAATRAASWIDTGSRPTFTLDLDPNFLLAWGAARLLLAKATAVCGADRVRAAAQSARARLSICLPGLIADLDERERAERAQFAGVARYPSSGPVLHDPVADAWAELFANLFADQGLCVVSTTPALIDPESWDLFPFLLRRLPSTLLVFADVPHASDLPPIRARVAQIARRQLARLEALRNARVEVLACEGAATKALPTSAGTPFDAPLPSGSLDCDDDLVAARLARGSLDTPEAVEPVVAAIRRAFDASAFGAVATLAEPLLARTDSLPRWSEIELLSALARHTLAILDPRLEAHDPFVQATEASFHVALRGLEAPADRSHALYHLCLFAGVARDLGGALSHAEEALREARRVDELRRPLVEGFALNVLALAQFRLRRLDEAIATSETALRTFEAGRGNNHLPAIELQIGRFKVLNNLARLIDMRGDRAGARRMFEACEEALADIPQKRPFFSWFTHTLCLETLVSSAEHAERCMEQSLRNWDENEMATYSNFAGLLRYMAGQPHEALVNYARAHDVWVTLQATTIDLFRMRTNCAVAAFRAGLLDDASVWLERVRVLVPVIDPSLESDVALMSATLEAARGNHERARRIAMHVTGTLEALGDDIAARARLHRALGDVYLDIGEAPAARDHFRFAHALMTKFEESASLFAPDDVFGALAGRLEAGDDERVSLAEAIALAPAALGEPNAWWDLPRVMRALARHAVRSVRFGSDPSHVLALCAMASQRPDCSDAVATVHAALRSDAQQVVAP